MDSSKLNRFLMVTLEMTQSDLDLLNSDRFAFLAHLIEAYDSHVPFQNLSTTTVPFVQRHQPTLDENIDAVFQGIGGRCWTMNSAMHVILKALGYEVECILGSAGVNGRNDHMMNIVKNLKAPGDKFLVDVGFGGASHPPVPLDFNDVSPVYSFYHQRVRWAKEGVQYIRQELHNPVAGRRMPTQVGEWEMSVFFTLTPSSLDEIKLSIGQGMYIKPSSIFNVSRRIWKMNADINKFVAIVNERMLIFNPDRTVEKIQLENDEQIIEAIGKYFPKFPIHIAIPSYQVWRQHDQPLMQENQKVFS